MRDDDVRVGVANRVVEGVRGAHGIGEGDLAHATEAEVAEGALGGPTLDLAALERATLGGGGARRARRLLGRGAAGGGEERKSTAATTVTICQKGARRADRRSSGRATSSFICSTRRCFARSAPKLVGHAAADGRHRDRGRGRERGARERVRDSGAAALVFAHVEDGARYGRF